MFVVYSKPSCTWCDQAKALLKSRGLSFEVIDLDVGQKKDPAAKYISREALLAALPGVRTMPQIVQKTEDANYHIGGYQELQQHLRQAA